MRSRNVELYRQIIEQSPDARLVVDHQGTVLVANPALGRVAIIRHQLIVDRPLWTLDCFDREQRENIRARFHAIEDGRGTLAATTISGQQVVLELSPIDSEPESDIEVKWVVSGLERNSTHLAKIGAATEAIGHFAASLLHDFNNRLAGIQTSFMLFKDAVPREHPHYRFLQAMDRELDRLAALSQRLRYAASIGEKLQAVPIRVAVDDVVAAIRETYPMSSISTNLTDTASLSIPEPVGLFRPVLYSLLSRAVIASPAESLVSLKIRKSSTSLFVSTFDSGSPPLSLASPEARPGTFAGADAGLILLAQYGDVVGSRIDILLGDGGVTEIQWRIPLVEKSVALPMASPVEVSSAES